MSEQFLKDVENVFGDVAVIDMSFDELRELCGETSSQKFYIDFFIDNAKVNSVTNCIENKNRPGTNIKNMQETKKQIFFKNVQKII